MSSAGGPRSYWLIVPAAAQPVEVLPGQVMMIYPAVQPQLLFAAGASHPPVMTHLASGASGVGVGVLQWGFCIGVLHQVDACRQV
jgi:hypothetical protein